MSGLGLSGIRCLGEGCFSRKERKERKDDGRVEGRGFDSRVEHVERVERVDGGMWSGYGGRLIYLKGYRDGTSEDRVRLLKSAIENLLSRASLTPPAAK